MLHRRQRAALASIALVAALAGCGSKKHGNGAPPAAVTGLAAVPATARVVVGADVAKLAASPIVKRAVEQLFLRDATLSDGWSHVRDACKLDLVKQVKRVMLVLGPEVAGAKPGTGPVLMIATGAIPEQDLASCVRSLVGKGGGALTAKALGARTLYTVKDGNRVMYLAYGDLETVVMGTSEPFVTEALSTGPKVSANPAMAVLLDQADQNAPLWAVGQVNPEVREGLVRVASGALKAGPTAFIGSADPTAGATLELRAIMATPEDAKQLESMVKAQLGLLIMGAQLKSLGGVVSKVVASTSGTAMKLRAELTPDDVNHVLSMLDEATAPTQDAPPAPTVPAPPTVPTSTSPTVTH